MKTTPRKEPERIGSAVKQALAAAEQAERERLRPTLWVFNLRIPAELRDELEQLARTHNRSVHGEVMTAVESWLRIHRGDPDPSPTRRA